MWWINGIHLPTHLGPLFTIRGTTFRPDVSIVRTPLKVAGRHGSIRTSALPVADEGKVLLSVQAHAFASQRDLESAVDKMATLWFGAEVVGRQTNWGVATSDAEPESISHDGFVQGYADTMTLGFALLNPFLALPPEAGRPTPFPTPDTGIEVQHLAGSSAPIGDAIVRITGPWTNPLVTCSNSRTGVKWAGTVPSGQFLFLDPRRLRARLSADAEAWESGGTDVSQTIDYPPRGRLQLWPRVTPPWPGASIDQASAPRVCFDADGSGMNSSSAITIMAGRCFL